MTPGAALIIAAIYIILAVVLGMMARKVGGSFWVWAIIGFVITPMAAYALFFVYFILFKWQRN